MVVRWHYYDPNENDWDWYAQIDDVALMCNNDPNIAVSPDALDSTQVVDSTADQTLTIENTGGGTLSWAIEEGPLPGGGPSVAAAAVDGKSAAQSGNFTATRLGTAPSANTGPRRDYSNAAITKAMRDARSAVPGVELVMDGSFEAGSPNPFWSEFSANFGSPLCTTALCGTGGGTGPSDGDWFVWFGGISGTTETGIVAQAIEIPAGSTFLSFMLEMPACDSADDFMQLIIGDILLYQVDGSSSICEDGYYVISGDISGIFEPGTYTVQFQSQTVSTNGGVTNFFVDEVSLDLATGCQAPGDVPWLSVSPLSGTTAAGPASEVTVTTDATGLDVGTYEALVCINSNDATDPLVEIPVSMTVEPAPVLVNDLLDNTNIATSYDRRDPRAPAGVYTIEATFHNVSEATLYDLYFLVVELTNGNLLLNADGGPGGVGSILSVTNPESLAPGESVTVVFEIGLQRRKAFDFFVDIYAAVEDGVMAAVQSDTSDGLRVEISEDDLSSQPLEELFLPLLGR